MAGLLLAAGEGSRLGRPKALLELGGERLVDRGVRLLEEGGCHPVVVVLGAATVQVRGAVTVRNPDWRSGMGSSLRAGLAALPPEAEAVVVALVDQPLVRAGAVRALRESGARLAVATYGGRRRNPVLIGREHFAGVAELAAGDVGARPYLKAHPELVTEVACDEHGDPADIDTPRDLEAAAGALEPPGTR
ncbi:molybdopterin-guanine dinucleotide biosynthesis protein A [Nonomuraea sp. WAC 01424]|uniref:nucleotidyltransferase family protein n=1 Tax=Nonomuraea sp. WAC 01424 TaxID=2203200 RepID=UPI000F7ACAD4|nr:nucleotidyltransferase family protein [Nonomuraea sp. WAC 01424]RSN16257.1 molybdopterin-guanine dinucleotide biosynthesis protein A [Nonomuraea sp. WAC 01424]